MLLERYAWPGNIRELENAVVRAVAMCEGTIRPQDLPERIRNYSGDGSSETIELADGALPEANDEWVALAEIEGRYVTRALEHMKGNKQATARLLGVDRKTLDRMIKRHNINFISVTRFPSRAA